MRTLDEKKRNIRWITQKLDLEALSQYSRFNVIIRTPGDCVNLLLGWFLEAWKR